MLNSYFISSKNVSHPLHAVGALTSKPYAFKTRPWESKVYESVDLSDSTGSNVLVQVKDFQINRVIPKSNIEINESLISDKARFSFDSIRNQRIDKIFFKNKTDSTSVSFIENTWENLMPILSQKFNKNNKTLLILDDSLDFDAIKISKELSRCFHNKIAVKSYEKHFFQENFFKSWCFNNIASLKKESKFCFLLSSNIKVESAILNAKIRLSNTNLNLNVYSLIQNLNSNFSPKLINLNLDMILNVFESRSNIFSKLLTRFKNPTLVLGNTLENRGINLNNFTSFVKSIAPTSIILNILTNCNTSGHSFLNIKTLNSKNIKEFNTFIFLNLKPNLNLHKYLKQLKSFNKEIFWFATHGSELLLSADVIVPCSTSYEEDKFFLNMEERPQKVVQMLPSLNFCRSLKDIFFFDIENNLSKDLFCSKRYDSFLTEICLKPFIFKTLKNSLSTFLFLSGNLYYNINPLSLYPFKTITEDFYCSTLMTKNSKIMLECSKDLRKKISNFFS